MTKTDAETIVLFIDDNPHWYTDFTCEQIGQVYAWYPRSIERACLKMENCCDANHLLDHINTTRKHYGETPLIREPNLNKNAKTQN